MSCGFSGYGNKSWDSPGIGKNSGMDKVCPGEISFSHIITVLCTGKAVKSTLNNRRGGYRRASMMCTGKSVIRHSVKIRRSGDTVTAG